MAVQDLDDAFSEHNGPLHLVLGLLSAARRLDRALTPRAPTIATPPLDDTPEDPPTNPRDDAPMYAALGLLALRERLLRRLARVPARGDPEPQPSTAPLPSELLR